MIWNLVDQHFLMWGLPRFMLGITARKKQFHLRNQELGNGLKEGGVVARLVESEREGRKWK